MAFPMHFTQKSYGPHDVVTASIVLHFINCIFQNITATSFADLGTGLLATVVLEKRRPACADASHRHAHARKLTNRRRLFEIFRGQMFCRAPPLFWLYMYVYSFGKRFRDGQYILVSFLFVPGCLRVHPFVKVGACAPVPCGSSAS